VLLLDTHAWIWTVEGDLRRVGRRSLRLIAQGEARTTLRISPATLFEIVALHTAGRLGLSRPVEQWLDGLFHRPGVHLAEMTRAVAVDAGLIPRTALPDPLDRVLVATARQLEATFLTGDARVLAYAAETGNVRVHDLAR
jgi:PIN domain nuclease of toxin-antitoxin system